MGGAQPLAVTMNGGVVPDRRRRPARLAPPGRAPLPRRGGRRPGRRDRAVPGREARAARRCRSALRRQRRRRVPRAAAPRRRRSTSSPTRPRAHDPLCYLPDGRRPRRLARLRRREAGGVHRPGARVDGQARRGDGRLPGRRRRGLRLRQLDPRRGPARRLRPRLRLPRLRARPTSGRCSARARARSAGPRCPATRRTSPPPTAPSSSCSRTNERLHRWIRDGAGARSPSRACRRASAGSATASATWPGCGSTRWSPPASSARRS